MSMVSRPLAASLPSKSTRSTSILGSQRASASRMACSMLPMVFASIESNTKSCTPQPNSGRMGRSPGAVPRMSWIACSMSCSSLASAICPRRSTCSGKARPDPMISVTLSTLTDADRRALDTHGARALDRDRGALERERRRGLDIDGDALDGHRAAGLDHERLRLLLVRSGGVVLGVALDRRLLVLGDLDDHLLVGLDLEVLLGVLVDLLVAQHREGSVTVLEEVRPRLVLAVEGRAEHDRAPAVAVLEADHDFLVGLREHQQAARVAGAGRRD